VKLAWSVLFLLAGVAHAADPLHAGVPVDGVESLGAADFLTPELGWSAPIPGGFVRVFVGDSQAAASAWAVQSQMAITVPLPGLTGLGDEAWGDGVGLLIVRDRNVAIQVRVHDRSQEDARVVAERMLAAIPEQTVDWPEAPTLVQGLEGHWRVEAPGAVRIQYADGGVLIPDPTALIFSQPPGTVTAWDVWGRPAVLSTDQ
jgi:hypothetical protein